MISPVVVLAEVLDENHSSRITLISPPARLAVSSDSEGCATVRADLKVRPYIRPLCLYGPSSVNAFERAPTRTNEGPAEAGPYVF